MKRTLKQLIAQNETEKVIQQLLKLSEKAKLKDINEQVILISARFKEFKTAHYQELLSSQEATMNKAKINKALLSIINDLPKETESPTTVPTISTIQEKTNFWKNIGKAALLIGILAGIAEFSGCNLMSFFEKKDMKETEELTVYVHSSQGKQNYVLEYEGELLVDLNGDRRYAKIGEKGRTVFNEIPTKFLQKDLLITVKAKNWVSKHPDSAYKWTGDPIYFEVTRDSKLLQIKGIVKSQDGNGFLENVLILIENEWTTRTDELGRFSFQLNESQFKDKYSLTFKKETYETTTEFYYSNSSKEFRLKKVSQEKKSDIQTRLVVTEPKFKNYGIFANKIPLKRYQFGRNSNAKDFNEQTEVGYYGTDASTLETIPIIPSDALFYYHNEIPPNEIEIYYDLKSNKHSGLLKSFNHPRTTTTQKIAKNLYLIQPEEKLKAGVYSLFYTNGTQEYGYFFKII